MPSSNYVPAVGILDGVVTFGEALKILREKKKHQTGPEMAIRALGPESTKTQRQTYTNYLSRIETGGVKSIGLDWLRALSKGLGFPTLGLFFSAIDVIEAEAGGSSDADDIPDEVESGAGFAVSLLSPHESHSFSASSEADRAMLTRFAAAIVNVVADAEPRRQDATARRKPPARLKNHRANRR